MKPLARHGDKILAMAAASTNNCLFYSVKNVIYRLSFPDIHANAAGAAETTAAAPVVQLNPGILIRTLTVIEAGGQSALIAGDSSGAVSLFPVRPGPGILEKRVLDTGSASGGIYSAAWSPERGLLVLGNSKGSILIFSNISASRLIPGEKIAPVPFEVTHRGIVRGLAFSDDGRYLASGGFDGAVMLWDLESQWGDTHELHRLRPVLIISGSDKILSITFSGDGEYIIFSDNHNLRVCPTRPDRFYEILSKGKKREFSPEEWALYIGESIKQEEFNRSSK